MISDSLSGRQASSKTRNWLWVLVAALLVFPVSSVWLADVAHAQSDDSVGQTNERSNFWRAVRGGQEGYSAIDGQETNVLMQNGGQNWRAFRNGPLATYGSWLLAGSLAILAIFYLLWGSIKLKHGRSDYTVERWTMFDRALHWFTAISFILLAISGLSLMYGRELLIPFLGKSGFAAYANAAKLLHNFLGPFFAATLLIELFKWMRHNFPTVTDLLWLLKGGGILFKSAHPSAGRMNAGEKIWFWILFWLGGVALVGSGFVLNFPNFGQTREIMQLANIVHLVSSLILVAVAFGHIYIGTLGTEGALEGMVTGRVDVNWAKQHHDQWYEELRRDGVEPDKSPDVPPPAGSVRHST